MGLCSNGHSNPDESHFCGECGERLIRSEVLAEGETAADAGRAIERSVTEAGDGTALAAPLDQSQTGSRSPTPLDATPTSIASTASGPASAQTNVSNTTPPTAAAAWYPDPHTRFEERYWDGTAWTGRVRTAGRETEDSQASLGGEAAVLAGERASGEDPGQRGTHRKLLVVTAVSGAVVLVIAFAIAASSGSSDKQAVTTSGAHTSYVACLQDPKAAAQDCYSEFPEHAPTTTSPTDFTTTTTVPVPQVHHIGDLISYTVTSTSAPYATLQIFSLNTNAPCTLSFGCGQMNNGSAIAAVDLQVCATGTQSVPYNTLGVKIVTSDNRQWDESAIGGPEPGINSGDLTAGTCKRGFASLKAPPAGSAPITGIVWDYAGFPATTIVP